MTEQNQKTYEAGLVAMVFLTWGTVFLDRTSLLSLVPYIKHDLPLSHEQVGLLASALALSWAFASLIFGAMSDRVGRRPILIPAVFAFSILSWLSGMVRTFGQMYLVRALMGAAEGPTWATITATVEESSAPERRGRNVGIVVSAAALVGLLLLAVSSLNAQEDQTPQPGSASWFGFAVYPGAHELCTESVMSTDGREILWRSFATKDGLDRVAAFYAKKDSGIPEKSKDSITFRHGDDIILSIHPASADYPKCSQKARAAEKTVIVVSQMINRGK